MNDSGKIKPGTFIPVLAVLFGMAFLLLLYGCTSTGKNYYQISLPEPATRPVQEKAGQSGDGPGIIMIKPVEVDEIYNDFRLVYRYSPHQLNYYNYHFWIKKPEKMIRESISAYLEGKGAFRGVVTTFSQGEPDLVLNAVVHVMEEYDYDQSWHAHLKMDFEVTHFKNGKTLLVHSFDNARALPGPKVRYLPRVLSEILKDELDVLLNKLENYLSK